MKSKLFLKKLKEYNDIQTKNAKVRLYSYKDKKVLTPQLWLDLYTSYSIGKTSGDTIRIQRGSVHRFSLKESTEILNVLNLKHNTKTELFKFALLKFLNGTNIKFKWAVVNELFKRHVYQRPNNPGNFYVSLSNKSLLNLFNQVGYKFLPYGNSVTKITYGSFYINNQWIHIG